MEMRQSKFKLSIRIECDSQGFSSSVVVTIDIRSVSCVFNCFFIVSQKIITSKNTRMWFVKQLKNKCNIEKFAEVFPTCFLRLMHFHPCCSSRLLWRDKIKFFCHSLLSSVPSPPAGDYTLLLQQEFSVHLSQVGLSSLPYGRICCSSSISPCLADRRLTSSSVWWGGQWFIFWKRSLMCDVSSLSPC